MEKIPFVEELISSMSLEEKVAQMVQVPVANVSMDGARKWAAMGAGSFLHVLGDDARELQSIACNSGHKIPVLFGIDAIHGHCLNKNATIFPSQLAMACSWNPSLVEKVGRAVAAEVATDGLHWTFSPVLCLARDPRWGRVDETFGEDSYLSGELGAAIIRGYQGSDLSAPDSILACAKHYIGYGEAVGARDACDTEMTYRKMRAIFLPPFEKAVEAGCQTIMTAYGCIDGTPFTIDKKSLRDILKDELGFGGFVVTDWDNVNSLVGKQMVCSDVYEASRKSVEAGNDMIMVSVEFYDAAVAEVRAGRLSESLIDDAVRHILNVKYRMGLFEQPEKKGVPGCIGSSEHHDVARQAAEGGVVLLRNNGILPLDKNKIKKIAIVGPNADDIRAQYGDWTYFTHPIQGIYKEPVRPYVTLKEGISDICSSSGIEVSYALGCSATASEYYVEARTEADLTGSAESDIDNSYFEKVYRTNDRRASRIDELKYISEAVKACEGADVIVLAVGDNYDQHGEYKDRADLSLSGLQDKLFETLKDTGIPIVTVLISSKPLAAVEEEAESDAFVCAFNGGMYSGEAIARILFGDLEPTGRLPISFPRHSGQLPVYYNSLPGWHGGRHVDCAADPLFAFGEGLSYSDFSYSNLSFDKDSYTVRVDVANTGARDSVETVQVYVHDVVRSVLAPVKNLAAFTKVSLAAGETKSVEIPVEPGAFSTVLPDETRVIEPGEFIVMAGHSSKDEDLLKVSVTF